MPPVTQYKQPPPFALQVELTEGCNLRCGFCGLNGIRAKENNFKFMTVELAERIVRLLKDDHWMPRIEFAMHGEPSANPDMIEILTVFRRKLPGRAHLMMTSNGMGFLKNPTATVDAALASLNVLALDAYENVNIVPRILAGYTGKHPPHHYPADKEANPHRRRKPGEHHFVIVQDIKSATTGTHSHLNNHAGAGSPKNDSATGKRCAKPFREMSIRWDGSVAVCCNDWRGEYQCGNVAQLTLEQVWQSQAMQSARRKLYHGQRDFGPCNGCDATSYRPGLLPDQLGKQSLPLPTAADEQAIAAALAHPPLTLPVLRPWELPSK
jgi:radical SAM protein with 4Fe4S-binding SPASM domain